MAIHPVEINVRGEWFDYQIDTAVINSFGKLIASLLERFAIELRTFDGLLFNHRLVSNGIDTYLYDFNLTPHFRTTYPGMGTSFPPDATIYLQQRRPGHRTLSSYSYEDWLRRQLLRVSQLSLDEVHRYVGLLRSLAAEESPGLIPITSQSGTPLSRTAERTAVERPSMAPPTLLATPTSLRGNDRALSQALADQNLPDRPPHAAFASLVIGTPPDHPPHAAFESLVIGTPPDHPPHAAFGSVVLETNPLQLGEYLSTLLPPVQVTVGTEIMERLPLFTYRQIEEGLLQAAEQGQPLQLMGNSTHCSICLEDYLPDDSLRILFCRHFYHQHCIDQWLTEESVRCPICRDDSRDHSEEVSG